MSAAVATRLARQQRCLVRDSIDFSGVDEAEDVRVLQIRRGGDLGEEALGADDRGQFGVEHLDVHTAEWRTSCAR